MLCKSCKNPETDLIITKNDDIIRDCKACGERTAVDMRHKLTTFIVKNPPKNPKRIKASRKGTADGSPSPANGHENGHSTPEVDAGGESDDELTRRIKAEAAELNTDAVAITKEDWSVDTSEEAVKARVKAVGASLAAVSLSAGGDEDSDDDFDSPYAQLGRWVEDSESLGPVEVYKKAEDLGIAKKHKTVQVLAQVLFSDDILAELPKYAPLFKKMVTSEKHQKSLLGGIERLVGVVHSEIDLNNTVPKILMAFYQADILEEDIIKQWGTHVSKKYVDRDTSKKVRKASEPFLKWLDEAEDSDDDEE